METDVLRLYAIGADDKALVLDLQKIIEPAVRTRLRQLGKNDRIYTFSVEDGSAIDDSGHVQASVLMQIPKQDGDLNFDVTLQVSQKNGALSAGDVSVRRSAQSRNGGTNTSVPLVPTFVTARAARDTNAGTGTPASPPGRFYLKIPGVQLVRDGTGADLVESRAE